MFVVTPQYVFYGPWPNAAVAVTVVPLYETIKLFNGQQIEPPALLTG